MFTSVSYPYYQISYEKAGIFQPTLWIVSNKLSEEPVEIYIFYLSKSLSAWGSSKKYQKQAEETDFAKKFAIPDNILTINILLVLSNLNIYINNI